MSANSCITTEYFDIATPPPFENPCRMASQQGKPNALPSPPQCSLSSEFLHRSLFCRVFFFLHNHLSSFSPRLLPPPASTFFPLPFLFRNLVLSPHLLISHPFVSHPFPILCFSFSASIKPASFSPSPPPSALQSPAGLSRLPSSAITSLLPLLRIL